MHWKFYVTVAGGTDKNDPYLKMVVNKSAKLPDDSNIDYMKIKKVYLTE